MFSYKDEWTDIFNRYAAGEKDAFRKMSLQDRFAYAAWALEQKGEKLGLVTGLGAHAINNLHAARQVDPAIPIVFIDTGYQHVATLAYSGLLYAKGYRIKTSALSKKAKETAEALVKRHQHMWAEDYATWSEAACDDFEKFLTLVQREPQERMARDLQVTTWATGQRRELSETQLALPIFAFDEKGLLVEFNPLADQTYKDIEAYQEAHNLERLRHPLVKKEGATRLRYPWDGYYAKSDLRFGSPFDPSSLSLAVLGKPLLPVQG